MQFLNISELEFTDQHGSQKQCTVKEDNGTHAAELLRKFKNKTFFRAAPMRGKTTKRSNVIWSQRGQPWGAATLFLYLAGSYLSIVLYNCQTAFISTFLNLIHENNF